MRCAKCRFENRESVRFCEECGAKLEAICPTGGAAIVLERKFCGNCGQALSQRVTSLECTPFRLLTVGT